MILRYHDVATQLVKLTLFIMPQYNLFNMIVLNLIYTVRTAAKLITELHIYSMYKPTSLAPRTYISTIVTTKAKSDSYLLTQVT